MTSEDVYRLTLLLILGATMAIAAYHRVQAGKSKERISRKEEGLLLAVTLRLAGLCLWLAVFAFLIDPAWMQWARFPLPDWLRWLGAVVGILGSVMMYWTLTNLDKNLTDTVVTRAGATLVTTGPYRWIRHPFYVTAGLAMLGAALLAANWFIGLCALVVLGMLAVRTPKEEQKLIEKFGDRYRTYMASTGRYWPKVTLSSRDR